ncbi:hypothetical protein GGTG_13340 [Gaeumannomyces tritici R3-111a-1]|uniref:C2H2-type domain-containing protein n=1 Tax=Gaeumannomyces tritici (strain R3-111a-1) TaxID=644352 RepID=J3PIL1_GAET3|nr:hypothetical protein GGTG_13340 [Gaeumannomyces tritici R3-111a-1]EJT69072.1 hypothetical protein GGTG_13340 [Gaeumannomyces tritici R3-111a-1]
MGVTLITSFVFAIGLALPLAIRPGGGVDAADAVAFRPIPDWPRDRERIHNVDSDGPESPHEDSGEASDDDSDGGAPVDDVHNVVDLYTESHTCRSCGTTMPSRNLLFAHLTACPGIPIYEMTGKDAVRQYDESDVIREIPKAPVETTALGGYQYAKMKIRLSINGQDVEICANSGAGHNMITVKFLDRNGFTYKFYDVTDPDAQPILGGWNSPCPEKSTKFAEITFFTPGFHLNGRPGILQQTGCAWLVKSLGAGVLLGIAFFKPREAMMDFGADLISFPQENFHVPIVTMKSGVPVVRKVTSKSGVVVPAGQTVAVPVDKRGYTI